MKSSRTCQGQILEANAEAEDKDEDEDKILALRPTCPRKLNITVGD